MKRLKIETPCQENWDSMIPTQQGAFCLSCEKQVHDVTRFSKQQIYQLLHSSKEIPCLKTTMKMNEEIAAEFDAWVLSEKFTFQQRFWFALLVVFGLGLFQFQNPRMEIRFRNFQDLMFQVAERDSTKIDSTEAVGKDTTITELEWEIDSTRIGIDVKKCGALKKAQNEKEVDWIITKVVLGMIFPSEGHEDPTSPIDFKWRSIFSRNLTEFLAEKAIEAQHSSFVPSHFKLPIQTAQLCTTILTDFAEEESYYLRICDQRGKTVQNLGWYSAARGKQSQAVFLLGVPMGSYYLVMDAESFSQVEKIHVTI